MEWLAERPNAVVKVASREGDGAEDGARTRDLILGKDVLYQLSYFRTLRTLRVGQWMPTAVQVPRVRIELTTPAFSVLCSTY